MTCLDVIEEKTGDQTRKTIQIHRLNLRKCTLGWILDFKKSAHVIENFLGRLKSINLKRSLGSIQIRTDVLNLMKRYESFEWIKKWKRFAWWIRKIGSKSDNVGTNRWKTIFEAWHLRILNYISNPTPLYKFRRGAKFTMRDYHFVNLPQKWHRNHKNLCNCYNKFNFKSKGDWKECSHRNGNEIIKAVLGCRDCLKLSIFLTVKSDFGTKLPRVWFAI